MSWSFIMAAKRSELKAKLDKKIADFEKSNSPESVEVVKQHAASALVICDAMEGTFEENDILIMVKSSGHVSKKSWSNCALEVTPLLG